MREAALATIILFVLIALVGFTATVAIGALEHILTLQHL